MCITTTITITINITITITITITIAVLIIIIIIIIIIMITTISVCVCCVIDRKLPILGIPSREADGKFVLDDGTRLTQGGDALFCKRSWEPARASGSATPPSEYEQSSHACE